MPVIFARYLPVFLLVLFLCACSPVTAPIARLPAGEGALELTLNCFRNDRGEALIYIYSNSQGFPDHVSPDLIQRHQKIHQGQVHFTLKNLPYNSYAISVLHDENRNGRMDKSLLGFPREGFGFSRNPDLLFGPPTYSSVRFLFLRDHQQQTIDMQYQTLKKKRPTRI